MGYALRDITVVLFLCLLPFAKVVPTARETPCRYYFMNLLDSAQILEAPSLSPTIDGYLNS